MNEAEARALVERWAGEAEVDLLPDDSAYDDLSPAAVDRLVETLVRATAPRPSIYMLHLSPIIHRGRGVKDRAGLVRELGRLSPTAQEGLFRLLQHMEGAVASERGKRRRGQFP